MKFGKLALNLGLGLAVAAPAAQAVDSGDTRVLVTIENLAPVAGTFQTPFWVGFHEGEFDTYDGNTPASSNPRPGSNAMEALCEDGNNGPIAADFADLSYGVDTTIPGPNGPIAPGDIASQTFVLDGSDPNVAYFSYASMILPSNDFCISNGNPRAHLIFNDAGEFVGESFFVAGSEVLDAGTEVNDEIPANTAFFGQAAPNTGEDENGVIGTIGSDLEERGFLPAGSGGILDDSRFRMADFLAPGYPAVKISFSAADAIVEDLDYVGLLSGENEVPAVSGKSSGFARVGLRDEGTRLDYISFSKKLKKVQAAHLHLGQEGENGPVVALLLPADLEGLSKKEQRRIDRRIETTLETGDLVGPLAGQPLDALIAEINAGNVYVNIHTEANPSGAIRGQLQLKD
ncbi:MAG: spondin domain-containing protein [Myxococcota bacterium]